VISRSQTKGLPRQIAATDVIDWFATDTGTTILSNEREAFARLSDQLFGFQLLQLGVLEDEKPMLVDTAIKTQTLVGNFQSQKWKNYLVAESDSLPVLTDSIDAVLLPHTLDFCLDPQKVLLEAERVLIAEGRLIISGFNPFSLWGIVKTLKRKPASVPMNAHFVSYTRMHDWLSLLGFDVEKTEVLMFRPPLESPGLMQKLEFMEKIGSTIWPRFGGIYLIRAVKRVSTLTPVDHLWKRRPRLLSQVVEPSTRGVNRGKTG